MATNPVIFPCPVNVWVKVAAGVLVGTIYRRSTLPGNYAQTIRVTGDAAPIDNSDASLLFDKSNESAISSGQQIDVYVKALGASGEVRVDL